MNFPTETPAARITEFGRVTVDGVEYEAHHITGELWNLGVIGKRGKVINQYRPARVGGGVVVYIGPRVRF